MLHEAIISPRRFDHQPPLADIVGAWFLDIHVHTCLASQDCGRRVPMHRRSHDDSIDRLVVENSPKVVRHLGRADKFLGRFGQS